MNKNTNPNVLTVCGTLLLTAVLVGIFLLAWHKTFSSTEVYGIVITVIGIAGGAFAVHSGVKVSTPHKTTPAPTAPPTVTPLPDQPTVVTPTAPPIPQ